MLGPYAVVLLSGGIDSTTALYIANKEFKGRVFGVSIDYGQRHKKEIAHAKHICIDRLGCEHIVLDLSAIVPNTLLTDKDKPIPAVSYSDIQGVSPAYVPFRNGLMLSAVASYAVGMRERMISNCKTIGEPWSTDEWGIYFGAHAEDAHNWAYPDCTFEFTGAMANAIYVGTYHQFRLYTPLIWMTKAEVIKTGASYGVPFVSTWSCYAGNFRHCGVCPTCRSRKDGFKQAGITDPTDYEV